MSQLLQNIEPQHYTHTSLDESSIGAHTRHILEYLEILVLAQPGAVIDYSKRERKLELEVDPNTALTFLDNLYNTIPEEDRKLLLIDDGESFDSTFKRELLYQHEHIIHHCAIIKLKLSSITSQKVDECFGFSKSTLKNNQRNVSS